MRPLLLEDSACGVRVEATEAEADELVGLIPQPDPECHKYSRGRVLVVAGSEAYPGAAVLAARGAERSGAGYVRLAAPASAVLPARMNLVSIPVTSLPEHDGCIAFAAAPQVVELARSCDCLVLGPGIGRTGEVADMLAVVLQDCFAPLVLDADGLHAAAAMPHALLLRAEGGHATVLTPHAGELYRLMEGCGLAGELPAPRTLATRAVAAREVARAYGAVVVAKGPATVITDGSEVTVTRFGSVALAKAGTGDVLSGIIGALVSQGMGVFDACMVGTLLHGRAGGCAARRQGVMGTVAEDVVECIGVAAQEILDGGRSDEQ